MTDIKLSMRDSPSEMILKMSHGFPAVAILLAQWAKEASEIDPDSASAFLLSMFDLEAKGIVGHRLHMLHLGVNQDLRDLIMVVRAVQQGFLPAERLQEAIGGKGFTEEEIRRVDHEVTTALPRFKKRYA